MQIAPKTGSSHQQTFTVDKLHTIDFPHAEVPPVLATPWLIWFLEQTALELMQPYLDEGEITVGTQVDMEHFAPTPCDDEVTCTARVVHSDGPIVTFQIEARDRHEPIARALHKRRVVSAARLGARVKQKAQG
jgi:predicted thioesterase